MGKRFFRWLSVGLLALLAACGGGGGGGSAPAPDNPPTADTTPNAFEFQPQFNVSRDGWATSNAIVISGLDAPAPISIQGGEYAIDSGSFTSAAGTIRAGQSLTIRVKAAATYTKATRATVTIGGVTTVFEVMSEVASFVPDAVDFDGNDVVFLLSQAHHLVFRWSIAAERYLDAYEIGTAAVTSMAYSGAHKRLYLGADSGDIRYIDVAAASAAPVGFAQTGAKVVDLLAAGNYVFAQINSPAPSMTQIVFNAAGTITERRAGYYPVSDLTWDPTRSRAFHLVNALNPRDLYYLVIDQTSGQIPSAGETPYHGTYAIEQPIRVSADGALVLLGTGDLYQQPGLTWSGALAEPITDAHWFADATLLTLRKSGNNTTLRHQTTAGETREQLTYSGTPLRVVGTDTKLAVLVLENGAVKLHAYSRSNDTDGDGVPNPQDAFPTDPAASVDSDHDGYPDAWNAGKSQSDSTTGLRLDAYPQDAACYLASHGDGTTCNPAATVPDYLPDQVAQNGDIVYLLSSVNNRVYRWSIAGGHYLNPYRVGIDQGGSTLAPTTMTYSSAHQRLYLGYSTGAIQSIDVTGAGAEQYFAAAARPVKGLAAVGSYLLAQDGSSTSNTQYVFNASGAITSQRSWPYYSRDYAWDPVSSRVYFLRDNAYPANDLHYAVIDQSTGQLTTTGETPYENELSIQPPIRVSANGQYVLLGSGDLYNRTGLAWARSIGSPIRDARWFADGSLVALATSGNQTTLRHLNGTTVLEQKSYAGQALRVVGSDSKMVVLISNGNTVQFRDYVPGNDSDGDGVANALDAFPADAAASVDTDHDGHPDSWNAGKSQSDSTTGLTLDAYPVDSGCYLVAHGSGGVCDPASTVPGFVPDQIVQQGNIVYLLSVAHSRIYRWSIATEAYLNPYVVGIDQGFGPLAPKSMVYSSAHQRLYLAYSTGAIRYVDTSAANSAEVAFTSTSQGIFGLASAGNYVLVQDSGGAWANRYVFDSSGTMTDRQAVNAQFTDSVWEPASSRLYTSYLAVHYEVVNQTTGTITSEGYTPCCEHQTSPPPVRVSQNGQYVISGDGSLFNANNLTWSTSLGMSLADARWFSNGSLVTLITAGNQTVLRRLSPSLTRLEQLSYTGEALRVVGSDSKMVVVVANGGTTQFHVYVPSNDTDGDGIANTVDAFPDDPAASVDTDHDGYPDAWNAGKTQSDSTTGLTLDAYPNDSACYLVGHGSGGICNTASTVPGYVPDQIVTDGDTVYLLSRANHRVYRWSIATGQYLNPHPVGLDQGLSILAPVKMAYSAAHQRLYLGYGTGAIQYIDTSVNNGAEAPFTNAMPELNGLAAVGNFVLAEDHPVSTSNQYIFNSSGALTDQVGSSYFSRDYAWDAGTSRVYFFRDSVTPNDLHYAVIDQTTGEITGGGDTPYHGEYDFDPPIRVSADGDVLVGSGDIYARTLLSWEGTLGKKVVDAQWRDHVLVDVDSTGKVEIRDADSRDVLKSYQYTGQPLGIVSGTTDVYLVRVVSGTTAFVKLPFDDQDGDSMPLWWEDLYGLSDSNAADASSDLDSDGVDNVDEYLNHSKPNVADTDADGLSDSQEIVTYSTNPARADSDGDGLSDSAEINTHNTDPLDADSDGDGYLDQDEVLFGGDPNDPAVHPQPLVSFSQSFEGGTIPAGWMMQAGQGNVPWTIDSTQASSGTKSLTAGPLAGGQASVIRFRARFPNGTLRFDAIREGQSGELLNLYIDGQISAGMHSGSQWMSIDRYIPAGVHTIEWRFSRDRYTVAPPARAWLDNVTFTAQ